MVLASPTMAARITVSAAGDAPAERVWGLLARPADWPAWAPHMWHVTGAGGEAPAAVAPGQQLRLRFPLVEAAVSLEVTEVDPGRSWTMTAAVPLLGTVTSSHVVSSAARTTRVEVTVEASRGDPVTRLALHAYRPVAGLAVRRLLAIAGAEEAGARFNLLRMCQPR